VKVVRVKVVRMMSWVKAVRMMRLH